MTHRPALLVTLAALLLACGGDDGGPLAGDEGDLGGAAGAGVGGSAAAGASGQLGKGGNAVAGTSGAAGSSGANAAGSSAGGTSAGGTSGGGASAGGTSAAGANAGGAAGASAGGAAGANAGGASGTSAGGAAGTNAGGAAGTNAGGAAGANAGGAGGGAGDAGFTDLTPPAGAQVVYVSSAGSDTADGSSPQKAVKTVAKGVALAKAGHSFVLLKRGDVFAESGIFLGKSGVSPAKPFVLGAYGPLTDERPHIASGDGSGLLLGKVHDVVVQSIHLQAQSYTGKTAPYGIAWHSDGTGLLVEDCFIDNYFTGVAINGAEISHVVFRRNVLTGSFPNKDYVNSKGVKGAGHAIGLYVAEVDHLTIEDNAFDHNGWKEGYAGKTIFNHNVYVQTDCRFVTYRNNVSTRASSHGAQIRPGGTAEDNFFLRDPLGLQFGLDKGGHAPTPGGVSGTVSRNVFLGGGDIDGANPRGHGIQLGNIDDGGKGAVVEDNVFAHNDGTYQAVFGLDSHSNDQQSCVVNPLVNLVIRHNTAYDWSGLLSVSACTPELSGVRFEQNVLVDRQKKGAAYFQPGPKGMSFGQNNWFTDAGAAGWFSVANKNLSFADFVALVKDEDASKDETKLVDAKRTIETYLAAKGLGQTEADFYAALRQQRRGRYDERLSAKALNAYFRAGFASVSGGRGARP